MSHLEEKKIWAKSPLMTDTLLKVRCAVQETKSSSIDQMWSANPAWRVAGS
jgi:hypothetical protein